MGTLDLQNYVFFTANVVFFYVVEVSGIEPLTSCMPCKRSPS